MIVEEWEFKIMAGAAFALQKACSLLAGRFLTYASSGVGTYMAEGTGRKPFLSCSLNPSSKGGSDSSRGLLFYLETLERCYALLIMVDGQCRVLTFISHAEISFVDSWRMLDNSPTAVRYLPAGPDKRIEKDLIDF